MTIPSDLRIIRNALAVLNKKLPQLTDLTWSIQVYSDGSGWVLSGLEEERVQFEADSTALEILDVINRIWIERTK